MNPITVVILSLISISCLAASASKVDFCLDSKPCQLINDSEQPDKVECWAAVECNCDFEPKYQLFEALKDADMGCRDTFFCLGQLGPVEVCKTGQCGTLDDCWSVPVCPACERKLSANSTSAPPAKE